MNALTILPARRWAVGAVVLLAVGARLAVMAPRIGRKADDPDNYLLLARSLASGRGFVLNGRLTAYRPPLYPMILAPLVGGSGTRFFPWIAGLHLALAAATVLLVIATARRWGLSPGRQLAAGFLVALDPVLVVQSRSVMTETLAASLLAAAALATTFTSFRGAIASGFVFGLAGLCRPSTLPAAGLYAVLSILLPGGNRWMATRRAAVMMTMLAVTLAPWAIRNAMVLGEPVWTTTHGGYTLALANNPEYYRDVLDGPQAVWSGANQKAWSDRVNRETESMTEPEADRFLRSSAMAMMRDRPSDFARASAARLFRFWSLAPSAAVYGAGLRAATAAWTAPFWVAVVLGLFRRESWLPSRSACLAILTCLTLVHCFFWTDMRMRAPAIPAFALVAATAPIWPRGKSSKKSGIARDRAVQNRTIGLG